MDEYYLNHFASSMLGPMGGSYGQLHQSQLYNQHNPALGLPQGPTGPSQINTLPTMQGNSPMASLYNMAASYGDQYIQEFASNRGRIATPISNVPLNMVDVMAARSRQAFAQRAGEFGAEFDTSRGQAAYAALRRNMGMDPSNSVTGNSIGSYIAGQGLQFLQGGLFSNFAMQAATTSNYFQGGATTQQILDLTNGVKAAGFYNNNQSGVGINNAWTRGLGLGAIGNVASTMMQRGMLDLGQPGSTALAVDYYSGRSDDAVRRLGDINDVLGEDDRFIADNKLGTPMSRADRASLNEERQSVKLASTASIADSMRSRQRLRDTTISNLRATKGVSFEKASSMFEDLMSANQNRVSGQEARINNGTDYLNGGSDDISVQKALSGLNTGRMMEQMGDFIKMVSAVGDMFETSSGDVAGILQLIDSIDSTALSQVSTPQLTKTFSEAKYSAQMAGLSTNQAHAIMQGASATAKGYGASFQEAQVAANAGMLGGAVYRNEFSDPGKYGNLTEGQVRSQAVDHSLRVASSEAGAHVSLFMSGYESRVSAGVDVSAEEHEIAKAYRTKNTTRFNELVGDTYNLSKYASYKSSNDRSAKQFRANDAEGFIKFQTGLYGENITDDAASLTADSAFLLSKDQNKEKDNYLKFYSKFAAENGTFFNTDNLNNKPLARDRMARTGKDFNELLDASDEEYEATKVSRLKAVEGDELATAALKKQLTMSDRARASGVTSADGGNMINTNFNLIAGREQALTALAVSNNTTVEGILTTESRRRSRRYQLAQAKVKSQSYLSEGLKDMGYSSTISGRMAEAMFGEGKKGSILDRAVGVLMPVTSEGYTKDVAAIAERLKAEVKGAGGDANESAKLAAQILSDKSEGLTEKQKKLQVELKDNADVQSILTERRSKELSQEDQSVLSGALGKDISQSAMRHLSDNITNAKKDEDTSASKIKYTDQIIRDMKGDYSRENIDKVVASGNYSMDDDTMDTFRDRVAQADKVKSNFGKASGLLTEVYNNKDMSAGDRKKAITDIKSITGFTDNDIDAVQDKMKKGQKVSISDLTDQIKKRDGGGTDGESAPANGGRTLGSGTIDRGSGGMRLSGVVKVVNNDGLALDFKDLKIVTE